MDRTTALTTTTTNSYRYQRTSYTNININTNHSNSNSNNIGSNNNINNNNQMVSNRYSINNAMIINNDTNTNTNINTNTNSSRKDQANKNVGNTSIKNINVSNSTNTNINTNNANISYSSKSISNNNNNTKNNAIISNNINNNNNKCNNNILLLIIKRLTITTFHMAFKSLINYGNYRVRILTKMNKLSEINEKQCKKVVWAKFIKFMMKDRIEQKIFRNVMGLGKRIQREYLRCALDQIKDSNKRKGSSKYQKMTESKKIILCLSLNKITKKIKQQTWSILIKNKDTRTHLRTISLISKSFINKVLTHSLNKLKSHALSINSTKKSAQIYQLSLQLQDLKIQVQNKNDNISRLNQQIVQIKQNSVIVMRDHYDNSSIMYQGGAGSNGCYSQARLGQSQSRSKYNNNNNNSNNYSNDGSIIKDGSYASLLGLSIFSNRSRNSTNSKSKPKRSHQPNQQSSQLSQQNDDSPCNNGTCTFKDKYQKYRTMNETLKKQLEIIKTQLEFTKDMNQHMENQIKSQYNNSNNNGGDGNSQQKQKFNVQKLRNQLKQSIKDREQMRDKIIKYQKYISKLKVEFKTKIQQIYRRVKKNTTN